MICPGCALELAPSLLSCPSCHTLVHGERLRVLADEAKSAAATSDVAAELVAWREAMILLPQGSRQHREIASRIETLSAGLIDQPAAPAPRSGGAWSAGAIAGLGLIAWKFKALIVLALTKGKLLLLGLTNATTLLSMLPAIGVYWAIFGWPFALGLVASIYVHEMGHVAALRRFGIEASAPMFIPGIGAVIRSRQSMVNVRERARVGLGGPIWGLGAAVVAYAIHWATGAAIWAAIGHFGAWVNLFNLIPVWQLDGAHAFSALDRTQRLCAAAVVAVAFAVSREGLLVLIAVMALVQAWHADGSAPGDRTICGQFSGLVAALTAILVLGPAPITP